MNNFNCSKPTRLSTVYFTWVIRDFGSAEWFHSLLQAIEEQDTQNRIEINIYLTAKIKEDDMNNIIVQDVGAEKDAITSLRAPTHFGRPNWDKVFSSIAEKHADSDVGVVRDPHTVLSSPETNERVIKVLLRSRCLVQDPPRLLQQIFQPQGYQILLRKGYVHVCLMTMCMRVDYLFHRELLISYLVVCLSGLGRRNSSGMNRTSEVGYEIASFRFVYCIFICEALYRDIKEPMDFPHVSCDLSLP